MEETPTVCFAGAWESSTTLTTTLISIILLKTKKNNSEAKKQLKQVSFLLNYHTIQLSHKNTTQKRKKKETIKEPQLSACSQSKSESNCCSSRLPKKLFLVELKFIDFVSKILKVFFSSQPDNSNLFRRGPLVSLNREAREISRGLMCDLRHCRCEINKNTFFSPSIIALEKLLAFRQRKRQRTRETSNGHKNEILIFIASASHQN